MYVTEDSTPVRNRQILAGTRSDVLLRINFYANDEDIKVTKTSSTTEHTSIKRHVIKLFTGFFALLLMAVLSPVHLGLLGVSSLAA